MSRDEVSAKFTERAESVQTVVVEAVNLASGLEYAAELTLKKGGRRIAAPGISEERLSLLSSICRDKGLDILQENLRLESERIDTGLTFADWGIARTATLAINSQSEDSRLAAMLCETHVAILSKSKIVYDIGEIEAELAAMMKAAPGYLAFVSGASRTADIERVLTIGVHGPSELHVVILEEDPA